ncbi:RHS repeat-associated core domain-containing protein [Anaerosporobacter faecicola]|uniref:RHS repeat-associated core domain-containing protein n=1 Tax=Anaerosporobacter faecicola TaxID=2718714 RepID=UPI00143BD2C5|nr:RHS repeat-associated core domain-containing protein [Anaerosporobacter faecicola]
MAKDSVSGKASIFTFSDEVIGVETSGNISCYRTDEKHSVTNILDETGKTKATIKYDEYGVIANPEAVSTGGNIFAYTGHVYDESTGLYYAKARYYDAEIGRFVSEDSYKGDRKELISLNQYTYGLNNPIKYTDLSGNMNFITQTDELIKGLINGMGSWLWDIIKSPVVLITIIKQLVCGELTVKQVIKQGLDYLVADIKYVTKHLWIFKPWKK